MDFLLRVSMYPMEGEKTASHDWRSCVGGCAANVAIALSLLGSDSTLVSWVGSDTAAGELGAGIQFAHLSSAVASVHGATTRRVFIVVSAASGERTAFLLNGDNPKHLTESQRKAIAASSFVYFDGSWPEVFPCVREICDSRSIPMSCNLDVNSQSSIGMFGSAEVGVASASACLAEETPDMRRAEDWLLSNWNVRRKLLVLTAGSRGSWAFDGDRMQHVHPPLVRIVDTTGAGDAYHAGIVYGVLANWPVTETIELATSLGALQCSHLGSNLGCLGEDRVREGIGNTMRRTETRDQPQ